MRAKILKSFFKKTRYAASFLLLAGGAAFGQSVGLTAAPTQATLPDGQSVPMWGYACGTAAAGASCTASNPNAGGNWSPVVITVPYTGVATSLTINLTNNLTFANGNSVPTSLVIVGQLGGGLGGVPTRTASPTHAPAGATWPASAPPDNGSAATAGNATFTPPPQPDRVQSFATEVAATGSATTLTWSALKPGTYLIHSGTHPSIQVPMGLYGVLVVTSASAPGAAGTAYPGKTYDADVPLVLGEIDPIQNRAVSEAVNTAGFSETKVWSGQTGQCGDPGAGAVYRTCYPPAVNYAPLYYLINGVSFDRTNIAASKFPAPGATGAATAGGVLLRLVNAGSRMHVPSVIGRNMTLIAEDGNVLPGQPRVQNEVFMAAGKTYDVAINAVAATATYGNASFPIYDRQLSLSNNNARDGGMQAYIDIGTGAGASQVGNATASAVALVANDQTYYCVTGTPLIVSDPAKGVLRGASGANGVALTATNPSTANVVLDSNGTFTYTPPATGSCAASFTYAVNSGVSAQTHTANIVRCDATGGNGANGCTVSGAPTANADTYTSSLSSRLHIGAPGVLANDTDPAGLPLTVDPASIAASAGLTVTAGADGSFNASAASPGTYTFTYQAKNSQGRASGAATVTVTLPNPSNLAVRVLDASTGAAITDYRWIIEEDKTFWIDPNCQIHGQGAKASCPQPVQSLGYNFHTASMPVVATGCVGDVSCEAGQSVLGAPTVCEAGNGVCDTSSGNAGKKTAVDPSKVVLDPTKRYYISVLPGDGINPTLAGSGGPIPDANAPGGFRQWKSSDCTSFAPGTGDCGHAMGGAQLAPGQTAVTIKLQQTPLPTSKIAVFVFEDDNPLNGENDAGGGVDVIAPNEPGLGGFEIKLFDQAGGLGDATGQITYDMFNQPVTNALAGTPDPFTGQDACPITNVNKHIDGNTGLPDRLVGMIPTCPKYMADGLTPSPLAGQAVIANLYPGLYEIIATPAADRIARGEEWLQTNTLDGGKAHEAFIKPNEPGYFQEFGPGGFHVSIGFANPKIINDRLKAYCAAPGVACTATLNGQVTNARMSRTPDQRIYSSGDYAAYGFTQCYIGVGPPDGPDFAFAKCNPDGTFTIKNIPVGDFKLTVFDQWNDIMLDGLVNPVTLKPGINTVEFPVTQWRTNMYTRTFIDMDGTGVSTPDKPGLPLVSTNIRYRDGSFGFFNNTDLDGYAGFNEVFPFMNWLVVETSTTRYKPTGIHVVNDTGGPADTHGGANSTIAAGLANTTETNSVPNVLRVPGAVYCAGADCTGKSVASGPGNSDATCTTDNAGVTTCTGPLSSGRIDPPQVWGSSEGWQGLLGQSSFIEFGMKPFAEGENGGITGHVIYASTRPFDDPALLLQLQWEPGVPRVKINLYQEGLAADGVTKTLKLVDTTNTTSFDDFAQGFRSDGVPNMNCPGQDPGSPFFATLQDSKMYLDPAQRALPNHSQFKCYDGWSQLNQVQPAPYDGMYRFPSVTAVDPTTGKPTGTNCSICVGNPDGSDPLRAGQPMLPPGKYVVEMIVPPGFELVKEEDKNILLGDIYVAPVSSQFAGFGNIFIMPDQAAVNASYNRNNAINPTTDLGAVPRHEGDTGSIETFWPCVGAMRVVPDYNSLFPTSGQNAPFAGATRPLCDRKEVTLSDQMTVLAKFYVFTPTHIAGHFTGTITNDFASEFDPFSPQFGEKFGPPNLPVGLRDFTGNEMARVYSDQWGLYNGLNYSSYGVNPPNPTGYVPQMMIACMNDPGPIVAPVCQNNPPAVWEQGCVTAQTNPPIMITDPSYNPAYSNFCYEQPFMPGFTTYMDTPVIPTQGFADGYNLPDSEYPDGTPAISKVVGSVTGVPGPWVSVSGAVTGVNVGSRGLYNNQATVTFNNAGTNGSGAAATSSMGLATILVGNLTANRYQAGTPTITVAAPSCPAAVAPCTTAQVTANVLTVLGVRRVVSFTINNAGTGYTSIPAITVTCTGTCVQGTGGVAVTATGLSLNVASVVVTNGGSGYTSAPTVTFSTGLSPLSTATGTTQFAVAPTGTLTITSLGDKVIQNPAYSGPNAATSPYNLKTITRHYGFGSAAGTVSIGGVNAVVNSWSDTTITVAVPPGIPACRVTQRGQSTALCGELVITAANGKSSIDAITVTAGGKVPTVMPSDGSKTIQQMIDAATPGDMIIVPPGTYKEHVLMWKPVRLQGVGAASVTINADAHPAGSMDAWRRQVNCLFGLALNGVPISVVNQSFDPTGQYTCPTSMFFRSDRIPFEAIVGWDASGNGNLAQVLQEPTLMGAYEGAGITVLGRGVRIPANSTDFWGQATAGAAGAFADGSVYLGNGTADCTPTANPAPGRDYYTGNFNCNPSSIDGLSIINSSQGGGAIFMHGWNHNLEVGNTRIFANHGTLTGGINLGNGETPPAYINDGTICGPGVAAPAPLCPPLQGTPPNGQIPFALNTRVRVHHNMIINNASIGDALFSGTPSGAGAITVSAGSDNYQIDHNWIAGNLSTGDGGGVSQSGVTFNGRINNNYILFNQSTNPTLPTNGGGLVVIGANSDRTLPGGIECGATTDTDCPPGIGDGTGNGLVIDANLIMGNSAETGSGGGVRLQQINGTEVGTFPQNPERWYGVTMTNNIIANNVAGWDGAGISLEDAFKVSIVNNTIASNDTTASAGVLFKTLGAINASSPPPGCTPTPDPTQPQNPNCLGTSAEHRPQPAGLVTMKNTPNMTDSLAGLVVRCPAGFGYSGGLGGSLFNANCTKLSIPQVVNDLFWHNRAFHVEIVGFGTNLQSQQNLVALVPQLNQTRTGECLTTGTNETGAAANVQYWDMGVRDDIAPNDGLGGAKLTPSNTLFSDGAGYGGANNVATTTNPLVDPYCNGSRVPPEIGKTGGYQAPPGRSETTGLSSVFVFNNITPAATVDEGHNWINLTYGPLTLSRLTTTGGNVTNPSTEAMVASSAIGSVQGAYSIGGTSLAANAGQNSIAPARDFFGNPRPRNTLNQADIGAVEFQPGNTAVAVVTPAPLAFGSQVVSTSSTQDLTLFNNGGAQMTGITVAVTGSGFSRVTTGSFPFDAPNCAATLNPSATCTIRVQLTTGSTANVAFSGSVAITSNVAVTNAPVALTGASVARVVSASVGPSPLAFGNWATQTTSAPLNLTVVNTGNQNLTGLQIAFAGGTGSTPFHRVTTGTFPVGAPDCGNTLAVGASCTVQVTFAPTAAGATSGRTITVRATNAVITVLSAAGATGAAGAAMPVSLTGTGVAARAAVSINAPTITLAPGETYGTNAVTLTNTAASGGANVFVTGVAVAGGSAATYSFSTGSTVGADTCTGATLAPGASCYVTVGFTFAGGTRGANDTGTIRFTDNGAGSPQTGALTGVALP